MHATHQLPQAEARNIEKIREHAPDLRDGQDFPRSPREKLGGYVLAARAVDKCRADLTGCIGDYHTNCPLDQVWLKFSGIDYDELRAFLASGASDNEVDIWIREHGQKDAAKIILWNNEQLDQSLSGLPREMQLAMDDYIRNYLPANSVIYRFFDIYDIEEKRL